jgi:hypothetical protein
MKIKEGFILRTICGQNVVSGEGTANVNFSKLVSLNDSAAYLFKAVTGKEFTAEPWRTSCWRNMTWTGKRP